MSCSRARARDDRARGAPPATVTSRAASFGAAGARDCIHAWVGSNRSWDVIASSFGRYDCTHESGRSDSEFETDLEDILRVATRSLSAGGKALWIPSTLAGNASAASVSNACLLKYNRVGERVFGGAGVVDLDVTTLRSISEHIIISLPRPSLCVCARARARVCARVCPCVRTCVRVPYV